MLDPVISLAFSIHSNRGVYAVLLGSGISSAAGIPTGWGIILDVIRKVASLSGESCEPDPEKWYLTKFGKEPAYSELLDELNLTAAERNNFLKQYIEPSADERENGLKLPTAAHRAIAKLVASGYVRVILTTNFDRLMESALEEVGVSPTVISTEDDACGAVPLVHSACTIVKLHGDYLDTRIKNTPDELATYDDCVNELLDVILDDYGLVVCGWSADWDTALNAAFARCPTRRYTTYWTSRSKPIDAANRLIEQRRAALITIESADSFFHELRDKIEALDNFARPHPLSKGAAVASLKRYLQEPPPQISLHDLVSQEAEKLVKAVAKPELLECVNASRPLEAWERIQLYEAASEILVALMSVGCYWSEGRVWVDALDRIANATPAPTSFHYETRDLRLYPALMLLYAGGIAAVSAGHYNLLRALLTEPRIRENSGDRPSWEALTPGHVLSQDVAQRLPGSMRTPTAVCDRLHDVLRDHFRAHQSLSDDTKFERCFDRFEYLRSLLNCDLATREGSNAINTWCPGRFVWRRGYYDISKVIQEEFQAAGGKNWPPIVCGFFPSLERFVEVKRQHDEVAAKARYEF
jgi:hypothetical protein